PFVMLQPICKPVFTLALLSACASVFAQMKSTPSMPARTMCATALPPPPPMPSTLITAVSLYPSISSNIPLSLLKPTNPQDLQIPVEPGPHPVERARKVVPRLHAFGPRLHRLPAVQQQSDARCVDRIAHDVRQTVDELRDAELRERARVLDLDLLGVRERRAKRDRDVVRDLVTRDRDHGGVLDRAAAEDRDVRRAAAHVDEADAELLLVLGQHRVARRELL